MTHIKINSLKVANNNFYLIKTSNQVGDLGKAAQNPIVNLTNLLRLLKTRNAPSIVILEILYILYIFKKCHADLPKNHFIK